MADRILPFEQFAALTNANCRHAFTNRVPGIEVSYDKAHALALLDRVHREIRGSLGLDRRIFVTAEQIHSDKIGTVSSEILSDFCFESCDALVTNRPDVCLGIYVADCCAVYLFDPVKDCIGLVHSGKKGTELKIVSRAISRMQEEFASLPNDLIVQLSPCIRPPHYEIDFAAEIIQQCREAGVEAVFDCATCTACDLNRYYSYRAEKGRTGRMLALLALA